LGVRGGVCHRCRSIPFVGRVASTFGRNT
jgi:hypothetical protein